MGVAGAVLVVGVTLQVPCENASYDTFRTVSDSLVGGIVDTRYELRRLIARGGMGLVFEAHHRFTRRAVALKLLPDEVRGQKEMRGRLLREAHALTAVRHPHIVEVLDAGVCAEHGPYVVMEMLDGRTLDGILAARRRLSIEDVVQVGRQVCDAVAHANSRGVVHRDLKPSNFFVARNEIGEETVKLIDLGVAALDDEQLQQTDRKLTHAHEVLGTPEYMAPEQLWGREIDARTDVYAIGMSLFECLTGEVPYLGTYPEVLVQVSNAPAPPSVRERRPDVAPALALVLETALEKEAANRFGSATELGRALVAASGIAPAQSRLLDASNDDDAPASFDSEVGTEPAHAIKRVRKKAPKAEGSGPKLPASPPSHRRQFTRAPYVTPVRIVTPGGSELDARSEEISEEGMLVLSPLAFPLGAALSLQFATPVTGEMIALDATVRWTREGRGRSALGVEFDEVPSILRGIVSQYISMFPAAHT
jgi:serine/threonine protein kinase